jgi:membrane protease YdiL (CAAX protease family)
MAFEQTLPPVEPVPPPAPTRERTPWGYADMAMAIGIVIGGTFLVGAPLAMVAVLIAGGADLGDDDIATAILLGATLLAEVFLLLAVALFTVGKYRVSWAALGLCLPQRGLAAAVGPVLNAITPRLLREAAQSVYRSLSDRVRAVIVAVDRGLFGLLLLVGALVVVWTYFAVLAALGVEPGGNIPEEAFDSVPLVVLVGVLSLAVAPFMEETFFRGFLFGGLRGRWGVFWAALGTGFLFSLAHIDPLVFIPFTAVGMLFALGYVYSGSLLASMIAHLLFNGLSFGLAVSGVST